MENDFGSFLTLSNQDQLGEVLLSNTLCHQNKKSLGWTVLVTIFGDFGRLEIFCSVRIIIRWWLGPSKSVFVLSSKDIDSIPYTEERTTVENVYHFSRKFPFEFTHKGFHFNQLWFTLFKLKIFRFQISTVEIRDQLK